MTFGDRLVELQEPRGVRVTSLPGQVVGLVPSLPHTRSGVIAMLEHGAVVQWHDESAPRELVRDLPVRHAAWIPAGPVVLLSGRELLAVDLDSSGVGKTRRTTLAGPAPVGVVAGNGPGQLAILDAEGDLTIYRLS